MFSAEQIISNIDRVSDIEAKLAVNKAELAEVEQRLGAAITHAEELLEKISKVWKIVDGIPIGNTEGAHGNIYNIATLHDDGHTITGRSGSFYPNANDETKWGFYIYDHIGFNKNTCWGGANWNSKEEVWEAIVQWIVNGTKPEMKR